MVLFIACAPASTSSPESVPSPKKITLDDATEILNLSLLLPSGFEQLDAASEGMSNEDLELGSYCSEVQLFFSEDLVQTIWCFLMIDESRIEQVSFDKQLEDEYNFKVLLEDTIIEGAAEEGIEVTVPVIEITHPSIGDSAVLGEGYMESYGYHSGFDTLWFRSNTVFVIFYSTYTSSDNQPLLPIAQKVENRLSGYEH